MAKLFGMSFGKITTPLTINFSNLYLLALYFALNTINKNKSIDHFQMVSPLFPSLTPRYIDSHWFQVDKPYDEEMVLSVMEKEHCSQLSEISSRDQDLVPTGQTQQDFEEEEDDDDDNEDDDDDDDNEDDDDDEEIEVDEIHFNPDSPVVNSPHF